MSDDADTLLRLIRDYDRHGLAVEAITDYLSVVMEFWGRDFNLSKAARALNDLERTVSHFKYEVEKAQFAGPQEGTGQK